MKIPSDRRANPRYPTHILPAVFSVPELSDAPFVPDDIGVGGFRLISNMKLDPGAKFNIEIRVSNSSIGHFEAHVIRSMEKKTNPGVWDISAKFVMAGNDQQRFSELLKKLADKSNFSVLIVENQTDLRQTIVSIMKTMGVRTVRNVANGRIVLIELRGKGRYGRTIGNVILPGGKNLNHELVKAGACWWHRRYAKENETLLQLEAEARSAKRGLWANPKPVPPWKWRRGRR